MTGCRDDVRGKYWWKCLKCDHSFESILNSMISSYKNPAKGCPYCSKFKITYENSFAYVCKEYMDEYSSNNEIDPTTVFPSNNTSVEWVCRMNPEHVWNATFRTRYARNGDCPACNNRRPVSGQNTFLAHYPELAKMQSQNKKCDLDNIFLIVSSGTGGFALVAWVNLVHIQLKWLMGLGHAPTVRIAECCQIITHLM